MSSGMFKQHNDWLTKARGFRFFFAAGTLPSPRNQEVLNRLKALREEKGWKIGLSLSGVGQSKTLAKALQTGPLTWKNGETRACKMGHTMAYLSNGLSQSEVHQLGGNL